jgi:hypothetical protein
MKKKISILVLIFGAAFVMNYLIQKQLAVPELSSKEVTKSSVSISNTSTNKNSSKKLRTFKKTADSVSQKKFSQVTCLDVKELSPHQVYNDYIKNGELKEIIDLENIHFSWQGEPARLLWQIEIGPNGGRYEQVKFFRLDQEDLPYKEVMPTKLKGLSWDQIKTQVDIDWQSQQGAWLINGNEVNFVRTNGGITDLESMGMQAKLYCRDSKCICR